MDGRVLNEELNKEDPLENLLEEINSLPPEQIRTTDPLNKNFGFSCNSCIINDTCKVYKADSECSLPLLDTDIDTVKDLDNLIIAQKFRVKRGLMFESVQGGGVIDPQLSGEMRFLSDLLNSRDTQGSTLTINAKGAAATNLAKGGILSQLLNSKDEKEVIDVTPSSDNPVKEP